MMLPRWIHTSHYTAGNSVELLSGGKPYFDALEACIREAQHTLHLQVYIFSPDETGQRVLQLLFEAVQRGVQVFLLVDAYGSRALDKKWVTEIRHQGIQCRFFGRLFSKNLSIGRRLHHKIVVVDAHIMLLGGLNIADRYNDIQGQRAWLDFAVRVQGPLAKQAYTRCVQIWNKKRWSRLRRIAGNPNTGVRARLSANDWLRGRHEITGRLLYAIRQAKTDILIAAAYFVPTASTLIELKKAVQRGVRVRIMVGRFSDVPLAQRATRYLYDWMFRHGLEIYEFTGAVLHAKIAVVDDCWASIGSYNLNFLSAFESLELNLDVADTGFAHDLNQKLYAILEQDCVFISKEAYFPRQGLKARIANGFAFFLLWFVAHVVSFFDRKIENS